jgi:hypothetical protein
VSLIVITNNREAQRHLRVKPTHIPFLRIKLIDSSPLQPLSEVIVKSCTMLHVLPSANQRHHIFPVSSSSMVLNTLLWPFGVCISRPPSQTRLRISCRNLMNAAPCRGLVNISAHMSPVGEYSTVNFFALGHYVITLKPVFIDVKYNRYIR